MILVAIIALSGVVLLAIAGVFGSIPSFPSSVSGLMVDFLGYLRAGCGFLWCFVNPAPVKAMLAFTLAIIAVYEGYRLVMWVMKKIPMFGVSD